MVSQVGTKNRTPFYRNGNTSTRSLLSAPHLHFHSGMHIETLLLPIVVRALLRTVNADSRIDRYFNGCVCLGHVR